MTAKTIFMRAYAHMFVIEAYSSVCVHECVCMCMWVCVCMCGCVCMTCLCLKVQKATRRLVGNFQSKETHTINM